MTVANVVRLLVGVTSAGFVATSLGLIPTQANNVISEDASAVLKTENAARSEGTAVQTAYYQAQGSLSDSFSLPTNLPNGSNSSGTLSDADVSMPDFPGASLSDAGGQSGAGEYLPPVLPDALPSPTQAQSDQPLSPPPIVNSPSLPPASTAPPVGGVPNSIPPGTMAPNGPPSAQVLPSQNSFPPTGTTSTSQPTTPLPGGNRNRVPGANAGLATQTAPTSNWERAQRELATQPRPGDVARGGVVPDRRIPSQPVNFQRGQGSNELRNIDNLREIQDPQARTGQLNPNSFATGLPYVTPPPRGRYPTSPYNHALFQNAAYTRTLAQNAARGPGQLASSQQLVPANQQQAIQPGIYNTSAVTCNPVLPQQLVVPQASLGGPLPQPSLPPPGNVPGTFAPATVTPNLAPGLYSQNNSGYSPLLSLGQEGYNVQLGRGVLGQPTVYVPGQPVRNFLRYLFP